MSDEFPQPKLTAFKASDWQINNPQNEYLRSMARLQQSIDRATDAVQQLTVIMEEQLRILRASSKQN